MARSVQFQHAKFIMGRHWNFSVGSVRKGHAKCAAKQNIKTTIGQPMLK